jgi:dihydroorotate dehydrogenase electron transfer subunit
MNNITSRIRSLRPISPGVFVMGLEAPAIASSILPGQFLNIRVNTSTVPLLRRPFSAYRVNGHTVEIIFQQLGKGTEILATKRVGDTVEVLGPLGTPFTLDPGGFDTGLFVAGGLGVAPVPLLTRELKRIGKNFVTLLGARNRTAVLDEGLERVEIATDDGSLGMRGTVVDLAAGWLDRTHPTRPKIFACGPTPMLRAVAALARDRSIPCELSLEGAMACGIGICQGCPVEIVGEGEKRYALMCKEGPVFDALRIRI